MHCLGTVFVAVVYRTCTVWQRLLPPWSCTGIALGLYSPWFAIAVLWCGTGTVLTLYGSCAGSSCTRVGLLVYWQCTALAGDGRAERQTKAAQIVRHHAKAAQKQSRPSGEGRAERRTPPRSMAVGAISCASACSRCATICREKEARIVGQRGTSLGEAKRLPGKEQRSSQTAVRSERLLLAAARPKLWRLRRATLS